MNPTDDATQLPPPSAAEAARREHELDALERTAKSKRPPLKIIGIAAAVLIGFGLIAALSNDDDSTASSTPVAAEADAGTGDASVDLQIVDTVWASNKDEVCPSFNELKATMPTLSDDEILDMGFALADMSGLTSAQLDHLRELALADC